LPFSDKQRCKSPTKEIMPLLMLKISTFAPKVLKMEGFQLKILYFWKKICRQKRIF